MQDRPTAQEILAAAREFCETDLGPNLDGRLRFHVRVLQNLLGILEREWDGEEAAVQAEWDRLQTLLGDRETPASFSGLRSAVKDANTELSQRIREGDLDAKTEEVRDSLYKTVLDKLAIANPNYA